MPNPGADLDGVVPEGGASPLPCDVKEGDHHARSPWAPESSSLIPSLSLYQS
jgi:hypothetical protein